MEIKERRAPVSGGPLGIGPRKSNNPPKVPIGPRKSNNPVKVPSGKSRGRPKKEENKGPHLGEQGM